MLRYVVEKGSIAVDGVSLTVAEVVDAIVYRVSDPRDAASARISARARRGQPGQSGGRRAGEVRGESGEPMSIRTQAKFATIEEAIEDIRQGKMVVVVDDENRENEGDLTMAAQFVTPEAINFMAKEGRGLICLALTPERCDELGLDLMAAKNESAFETAFTVSIEAPPSGVTHRDLGRRPRAHDPGRDRPELEPTRAGPAGPRVPAEGQVRRRARARRPDRGGGRPGAAGGADPGRRDLRDHERRRDDGAGPRPRGLLPTPRAEDGHGRRPRRLPPSAREADRAGRLDQAPDGVRRLRRGRLPLAGRQQAPRRARQGRGRRAPTTCSSGCTPSASPATCSTRCAATAASSSSRRCR